MAIVVSIESKYNPRGVKTAIRNFDDFKKSVEKAGGGFKGFADISGKMLQQVGGNIRNTGKDLSLGVTLPLVGIGAIAVDTAAKFETSMNQLTVATGAPQAEIEKLSGLAVDLGSKTVYSANDAADAMLELAKGGFKPAEIAGGGVQATMALAATEGMNLADAAQITSNAMNTFGIKASKAARIADALAGGSIASSASVEGLAQALSQVGPGATNAGLNLQQTVGALAAFADSGIKGSDAGTSLKTMLARLVPQTDKAAAMMKKLGLDFTDAKGNIVPITQVAGQLQKKLGGLSESQRITALTTIFGSDATRAATVLMKQGESGLRKYISATKDQGAAQEMANARMKGTAGSIEAMRGSLETAALKIGTSLAPTIQKIAKLVGDLAEKFSNLSPSTQDMIIKFAMIAAVAGPVLVIVGSLISAIGTIIGVIGTAVSVIGTIITVVKALGVAIWVATGPIGAIVLAIAAVIGILVLAYHKVDWFRNFVDAAWQKIKDVTVTVFNAVKNAIATAFNWVKEHWPLLLAILGGPIGIAAALIIKYWDQIKGAAVTVFNAVKGAILVGVNAVIDFARKTGEFIGKVIQFYLDMPGKILAVLKGAGTWLVNIGKDMIQGLLDGAGSLLSSIGEFFLDKLPWWIKEPFKKALGIASPSKVFHGFGQNIGEGLVNGASSKNSSVQRAGKGLADAMKKGTKDALQSAIDQATTVKGKMEDRLGRLRDFFNRARDIIVNAFASLKDRAQGQIDDLTSRLDGLRSEMRSYADSIRSAFSATFTIDAEGGKSVMESFRKNIQDAYAFAGSIKNLKGLGLNETSLQNIIQAGVTEGQKIADALLKDGPSAINEVNQLQAMLENQANVVADSLAQDRFGAQITAASAALDQAQAAYAAIAAREAAQLAQLDALAVKFGIETDAMTKLLNGSQKDIETLLGDEKTATDILADAVGSVTAGILETAATMARKAAALGRQIADLESRIQAAQAKADAPDKKRAIGGHVMAGVAYTVGELGRETFVPNTSGTILTARETRSMGGVTIAPGAVQVIVQGGDSAEVQAVVDEAFARLVRELQAL